MCVTGISHFPLFYLIKCIQNENERIVFRRRTCESHTTKKDQNMVSFSGISQAISFLTSDMLFINFSKALTTAEAEETQGSYNSRS